MLARVTLARVNSGLSLEDLQRGGKARSRALLRFAFAGFLIAPSGESCDDDGEISSGSSCSVSRRLRGIRP